MKDIGYIGFSDGWGDQVLAATKSLPPGRRHQILADERYARTDTSVEAQALKLISAASAGGDDGQFGDARGAARGRAAPSRLQGHASTAITASSRPAFIKVGGAAVEGVIAVTSPVVVYDQLPDFNPVKPVAAAFMKDTRKSSAPQSVSPFAGYSYDAMLLLKNAIPEALKAGKPGTEAFRVALRDALEKTHDLVGVSGVYTMSPTDHNGQDAAPPCSLRCRTATGRRSNSPIDAGRMDLFIFLALLQDGRNDRRDLSAARDRAADRVLGHARDLRAAGRSAGIRHADRGVLQSGHGAGNAVVARRTVRAGAGCLAATRCVACCYRWGVYPLV